MKTQLAFILVLSLVFACSTNNQKIITKEIGQETYDKLMSLSLDEFDQSPNGFRKYSSNYQLVRLLIPEYIRVHKLPEAQARNLHWHLGQMHAFQGNYGDAIAEMKQSYIGGSKTWECYVSGTIAFLEKDKVALQQALDTLSQQENQMNIQFLRKFVKYFDQSYAKAYNASN